ncbi:MAG: hypothetical protein KME60_24460 [Cyanomargarita calcarea GSE-NOS-MK-12-04C]|jgi:hypothetical protein|uniref:Glycosyl transferase n=1 Tax=Cyanomargarita calcarea GSE-NOS-MK-12-04C TaxID=2839659 RepID=A0A951UV56_9CYAN|nr:hypothetical protein [Cyanomargarita calcarea GSE-NOS-MK-12-04C]
MDDVKITFFMIVTDRDMVIADYAVKSYAKIKSTPFKLRVYSNWISSALKQKYFPVWRQFEFVEIVENQWQTDDKKPLDHTLEGPFELGATIWDRELKKIQTPYHATVDADFEIIDAKFIPVMLDKLDTNPNLVAISTDYSATQPESYDSYSDEVICLNERWHTWFCIYKREALQCNVSHVYYEEILSDPVRRNVWDDAGYLQKALKESYGFEVAVLDSKYQPCFIHYGQFAKNVDINESNVDLYRRLQIIRKRGLFGSSDIFTKKLASLLHKILFAKSDKNRSKYVDGWAKATSS